MQNLLLRYYEKILLLKSAIFRDDYQIACMLFAALGFDNPNLSQVKPVVF
jgi:hypothetical protein